MTQKEWREQSPKEFTAGFTEEVQVHHQTQHALSTRSIAYLMDTGVLRITQSGGTQFVLDAQETWQLLEWLHEEHRNLLYRLNQTYRVEDSDC